MRLQSHLIEDGFHNSVANSSMFYKNTNGDKLVVLIYVDDIIVTGNPTRKIDEFTKMLCSTFACRDLGQLKFFLGIECLYENDSMIISQ